MQIIFIIIILLMPLKIFASECSNSALCYCELKTNDVNFGDIIPYNNQNIMIPFKISVKCNVDALDNNSYNILYNVKFNNLNNDSRNMNFGSNNLKYEIYLDKNYFQKINDFEDKLTLQPGMSETVDYIFYAVIPSGQQYLKIGKYLDNLSFTLTY